MYAICVLMSGFSCHSRKTELNQLISAELKSVKLVRYTMKEVCFGSQVGAFNKLYL